MRSEEEIREVLERVEEFMERRREMGLRFERSEDVVIVLRWVLGEVKEMGPHRVPLGVEVPYQYRGE